MWSSQLVFLYYCLFVFYVFCRRHIPNWYPTEREATGLGACTSAWFVSLARHAHPQREDVETKIFMATGLCTPKAKLTLKKSPRLTGKKMTQSTLNTVWSQFGKLLFILTAEMRLLTLVGIVKIVLVSESHMFPSQVSAWRVGCRREVEPVQIQREDAVNELSNSTSCREVTVGHTAKLDHNNLIQKKVYINRKMEFNRTSPFVKLS